MTITRPAYVAALRSVADLFDSHDNLPLPYGADELVFYVRALHEALNLHALMDQPKITRVPSSAYPVRIKGTLAGMRAEVCIHADVAISKDAPTLPALVPALAALVNPKVPAANFPADLAVVQSFSKPGVTS